MIATPEPDAVIAATRSVGVEGAVIGEVAASAGAPQVRFTSDR